MTGPESITAALAAIEKREKQSRIASIVFTLVVCTAPLGIFFSPKGQPMVNIVLITLILYNTLLSFWIKQDISAQAVRILRAIQDAWQSDSRSSPSRRKSFRSSGSLS